MKAHEVAHAAFNKYAGMDTPDLPANPVSRAQVLIHRYYVKRDMPAQLLRAVRMLGEIGQMLVFRPDRGSRELRPEVTPLIADVLAGVLQLCTLLRVDAGALIEQTAQDLADTYNVRFQHLNCPDWCTTDHTPMCAACPTKLVDPRTTGVGENCIVCTECHRWFCDSCYDTSKGDGCNCHPPTARVAVLNEAAAWIDRLAQDLDCHKDESTQRHVDHLRAVARSVRDLPRMWGWRVAR